MPPAKRTPWVALFVLSWMTLLVSPKTALLVPERIPAATSILAPLPPKVLPALLNTSVPAPALVRTMALAPVAPPERMPLRVRPCVRSEAEAAETV